MKFLAYLFIVFSYVYKTNAKEFDIDMNVDDILNAKMMPLDLFLIHMNQQPIENQTTSWASILQTMSYHRKMMQQFMASDYLAQQILNWTSDHNRFGIEKRIGRMRDGNSREGQTNSSASDFHVGAVKKMLYDDGSAQYKAWLQRTTTLEDIQHQLEQKHAIESTSPVQRRTTGPDSDFSAGLDDTEDGDITGYAFNGIQNASVNYDYPLHIHPGPLIPRYTYRHAIIAPHLKEISKSGYDNSYDDYSVHSPPSDNSHAMSESSKQKKEISIKDITDIALTTLAFLSFGMFILQVLMCITMSKDDGSNLMMLPMEATESSDTIDGTEEIRRRKRSLGYNHNSLTGINQLSKLILNSVDNLVVDSKNTKKVEKHLNFLCNYSKFGKEMPDAQRIWIPLYSGYRSIFIIKKIHVITLPKNRSQHSKHTERARRPSSICSLLQITSTAFDNLSGALQVLQTEFLEAVAIAKSKIELQPTCSTWTTVQYKSCCLEPPTNHQHRHII